MVPLVDDTNSGTEVMIWVGGVAGSNSESGQSSRGLGVPDVQGKTYVDTRLGKGIPGRPGVISVEGYDSDTGRSRLW